MVVFEEVEASLSSVWNFRVLPSWSCLVMKGGRLDKIEAAPGSPVVSVLH